MIMILDNDSWWGILMQLSSHSASEDNPYLHIINQKSAVKWWNEIHEIYFINAHQGQYNNR